MILRFGMSAGAREGRGNVSVSAMCRITSIWTSSNERCDVEGVEVKPGTSRVVKERSEAGKVKVIAMVKSGRWESKCRLMVPSGMEHTRSAHLAAEPNHTTAQAAATAPFPAASCSMMRAQPKLRSIHISRAPSTITYREKAKSRFSPTLSFAVHSRVSLGTRSYQDMSISPCR
jgi:hypothetical protein